MTRRGAALLVALVALAGCGGTQAAVDPQSDATAETGATSTPAPGGDEQPTDEFADRLTLAAGESVQLPGYSADGEAGAAVPMSVSYSDVRCANTFEAVQIDEFEKPTDLVAAPGNQVCMVVLDVTNVGSEQGWFGADLDGRLVSDAGGRYVSHDDYDPSLIAEQANTRYSADIVGLAPGDQAKDYVIFELPAAETPVALVFGA
jgi:hypothetical protein